MSAEWDEVLSLSIDFVSRIKREQPIEGVLSELADLDEDDLVILQEDESKAKTFWINCYNGAAQRLLEEQPALFESRRRFFKQPAVAIADVELSLDDIEHGILRDNTSKYGFGYLPRLSRTGLDRSYRIELDPRIHFALNCGAASCPAILAYEPDSVESNLDSVTKQHLMESSTYEEDREILRVSRLLLWYIGDFGGPFGLRRFLDEYEIGPRKTDPRIRFQKYDWSLEPKKFRS